MARYRKKPVVIDAKQMPMEKDQDKVRNVAVWMLANGYEPTDQALDVADLPDLYVHEGRPLPEFGTNFLEIETLEGDMTAGLGDWIIKGVQGEFYPCKADIFEQTYEQVEG